MDQDQTFRIVLLAGVVLLFPAALYYRVRSQATGERLDRWQEGPFLLFTLRPLGIAAMVGSIVYMIDPALMSWSAMTLPTWLRWAGAVLGAGGGALLLWAFRTLGPNLTDTVVTRRVHTLVTGGPYRWVRHPFYDATALLVAAGACLTANWFILLAGVSAFVLMVVRTRIEEERLRARFGQAYREYEAGTGRFFPKRWRAA